MTNSEAIMSAYKILVDDLTRQRDAYLSDEEEYEGLDTNDVLVWFIEGLS